MKHTSRIDTANINGSDLYFETIGEGPPLLLMHGGLGLSHDYLRPYFDRLADSHTVIYYDHFGNGRSARPQDFDNLSFDRFISDAQQLIAHLGHTSFTLIGHSYGAFIAQEFAAQKQALLDGLVLISAIPALDYQPQMVGTEEQMTAFGRMFSGPMTSDQEWRAAWSTAVQMYFRQWDAAVGADLDNRTIYEHRAWNQSGALLATFNILKALPEIRTPTLVISGRHDGITPPEQGGERIANLLPNAELVVFEESAHYPFIEQENAFFETVTNWLARQRAANT